MERHFTMVYKDISGKKSTLPIYAETLADAKIKAQFRCKLLGWKLVSVKNS